MKNLILLIFLGASINASAQADLKERKRQEINYPRYGVTASLDISDRVMYSKDGSEASEAFIEFFEKTEVPKFACSVGLIAQFKLNKRFLFETGFVYANRGFKTRFFDFTGSVLDTSMPNSFRNAYAIHSLDIPAKFQCNFNFEKSRFFVVAGVALNVVILDSQKSVVIHEDESRKTTIHIDFVKHDILDISPCAGFGMEYYFGEKMSLTISPVFRFTALGYGSDMINSRIWSTAIQTSFFF
ncbi:MAG: outer membrane beta-barrel protein [Bacteroidetes bacterium]|nr:outer membrane beta-barrel protein [Bacteroidota bacterium]